MRASILIVLAACGRIGFDTNAGDDIAIDDDEDGDGVADDVDVCPCTAGTQRDSDGDGVGDDCDYAATTMEHLILFTTMKAGDQPFMTFGNTWRQTADALNFDGSDNGKLMVPIDATSVRVTFGFEIHAVLGPTTKQHQLAVNANTSEIIPHEFVELNEIPGTITNASVTFYDGANYSIRSSSTLPSGIHLGRGEVQLTHLAGVSITMDGGWAGEPYHLEFPTTLYTNATFALLNVNNLDVDVRYACVIATR